MQSGEKSERFAHTEAMIGIMQQNQDSIPKNLQLEKKYKVEDLGIKPFPATKPEFEFVDKLAETAWKTGAKFLF